MESASATPDPFLLREAATAIAFMAPTAVEVTCTNNFVSFPIATAGQGNQRCGEIFGEADGDLIPGTVPCEYITHCQDLNFQSIS